MEGKPLKLYVWEGVLTDYTAGKIIVLASSDEEAAELLKKQYFGDRAEGIVFEGVTPEIVDPSTDKEGRIWFVYGSS